MNNMKLKENGHEEEGPFAICGTTDGGGVLWDPYASSNKEIGTTEIIRFLKKNKYYS